MNAHEMRRISNIINAADDFVKVVRDNSIYRDQAYIEGEQYPVLRIYSSDSEDLGIICMNEDADYGYFDTTTEEFKQNT